MHIEIDHGMKKDDEHVECHGVRILHPNGACVQILCGRDELVIRSPDGQFLARHSVSNEFSLDVDRHGFSGQTIHMPTLPEAT